MFLLRKGNDMRLLHTSDLHIGRRMNGYSLIEDQKHILEEILQIAKDKKVDVLLIAGDVYDRHIPSEEAVTLFDGFITALANEGIPAMVTSGNHDSAERVGFGSHLMDAMQVFVSPSNEYIYAATQWHTIYSHLWWDYFPRNQYGRSG